MAADRETALSVPWAYGEEIAWHEVPGGNVVRRVDPAALVGDDGLLHTVDLGNGSLLVITGDGHALRVDQRRRGTALGPRRRPRPGQSRRVSDHGAMGRNAFGQLY